MSDIIPMFDILMCGIVMSDIIHMSRIVHRKSTQIGWICVLLLFVLDCVRILSFFMKQRLVLPSRIEK